MWGYVNTIDAGRLWNLERARSVARCLGYSQREAGRTGRSLNMMEL